MWSQGSENRSKERLKEHFSDKLMMKHILYIQNRTSVALGVFMCLSWNILTKRFTYDWPCFCWCLCQAILMMLNSLLDSPFYLGHPVPKPRDVRNLKLEWRGQSLRIAKRITDRQIANGAIKNKIQGSKKIHNHPGLYIMDINSWAQVIYWIHNSAR